MHNLRLAAQRIFKAALRAVDPYKAVLACLAVQDGVLTVSPELPRPKRYELDRFKRILVFGAGKAAVPMAAACERIFKKRIDKGLVVTKYGHAGRLRYIETVEAGHPVPDRAGLRGAKNIAVFLQESRAEDLIIFLTSGGCSALLPWPATPITLAEKQRLTNLLLRSGATINEINAVRKHVSLTKGGNLAALAYPSTVINLILSDVVGDDLAVIGSGPFVPDPSTYGHAWEVLKKYDLMAGVPPRVMDHLHLGLEGKKKETPKPGHPCFRKVNNVIVASNLGALKAAEMKARTMGFKTLILSSQLQGEARELAIFYAAMARELCTSGYPLLPPACILGGGEPTVTVWGEGRGGRNTELALAFAIEAQKLARIAFLSAGTDGTDGPTDAAGAMVNGRTYARAWRKKIRPEDYLKRNDAYTFFKKTGGLVMTGPTRTNVMDIHILLSR